MKQSREFIRDGAQVGGFFGFIAGLLAFGVVMIWALIARLGDDPPKLAVVIPIHLINILLYAFIGALIGAFRSVGRRTSGRLALWVVGAAAGATTLFSVASGPLPTWSPRIWGQFALTSIAFGLMFGWPDRRPPEPPAPSH